MYHFIINPAASSGKGKKVWQQVEQILKQEHTEYTAHFLQSGQDAERLAAQLTDLPEGSGDCHLVVLGGDGTLNSVLQGIVSFSHTKLSCISTGSGNDFAKDMEISKNAETALKRILHHPREILLDYGELSCLRADSGEEMRRRFIISSGVGYDAEICEEVGRSRLKQVLNRLHLGKLVYVFIGVKQIFTRKAGSAVLRLDDRTPVRIPGMFFLVGMIHRYEGGGVPFCPGANPSDGLLDVCLVEKMPKWKLLLAVLLVYRKKHFLFRAVSGYQCRKLTLETDQPEWFHMDGETPFRIRKITLECRPGLRLLT